MDYFTNGLFRPALFAFSILLCVGSLVGTADAFIPILACTGNQIIGPDGFGDTCTSSISGGGTAASATAENGGSTATSTATNSGTATSTASDNSTATSTADTSGTATSTASDHDSAMAFAVNSGTATSTATKTGSVVCVFAGNSSSTAVGNDTATPTCGGTDSVVVSPAGDCHSAGVVIGKTPCGAAAAGATPEIDPTMAAGGLTILLIGFVLLMERRRAQRQSRIRL